MRNRYRHAASALALSAFAALAVGSNPTPIPASTFTLDAKTGMVFSQTVNYSDSVYGWDDEDTKPVLQGKSPVTMTVTGGWPRQLVVFEHPGVIHEVLDANGQDRTLAELEAAVPWNAAIASRYASTFGLPGAAETTEMSLQANLPARSVRYAQHGACAYRLPFSTLFAKIQPLVRQQIFNGAGGADSLGLDSAYEASFLRSTGSTDRFANHDGFSMRLALRLSGHGCYAYLGTWG